MNLYFWKVQRNSAEIVQTNWILHLSPPVVQVETPGTVYRITGTGVTYKMSKPLPEQLTGCPFPTLVLELAVRGFLFRHRSKMPWFLFAVVFLAIGIYAASAWMLIEHPAAGEMVQNALWNALLWTVAICATLAAVRMYQGFSNSAKYVWQSELARMNEVRELPAGEPLPLDLGADVFVAQKNGESAADFLARVDGVRNNLEPGVWAVVMAFQDPLFIILTSPTKAEIYNRATPPFHADGTPEDERMVPTYAVFDSEEYEDFEWYLKVFAAHYRRWVPAFKSQYVAAAGGNAASTWFDTLKAKAAVFLFLLFAGGLSAQSADAVQKATANLPVPKQGQEISYVFSKKTMGRVGNGRSGYAELLKGIPTYRDCCHGPLIAVYNGETVVAKGPGAEEVADKPTTRAAAMRPVSAIPPDQVEPGGGWQMPDSATNAAMAERVKFEAWRAADGAGRLGMPWIDVVFYLLLLLAPVLIILGYLLRFGAGFFASEGMLEPHKWCRAGLAYIVFIGVGATLLWVMIASYKLGVPPWALVVIAGIETWLATKVSKWFVPDFRPAAGNGIINRRGAYENGPGLNSGL